MLDPDPSIMGTRATKVNPGMVWVSWAGAIVG